MRSKRRESGMPLGGIGAGRVDICPDGAFRNLTWHNNIDVPVSDATAGNTFTPAGIEGAFCAIAVEGWGGRLLKAADKPFFPTIPSDDIAFDGQYPRAILRYPKLGDVDVELELFSPLLLDDPDPQYKNSSLPALVVIVKARNGGQNPRDISLLFSWPKLIGTGGYPNTRLADPRGNEAKVIEQQDRIRLLYYHTRPKVDPRLNGEHELCAPRQDAVSYTHTVNWWFPGLWDAFVANGELPCNKAGAVLTDAGAVYPGNMGSLCARRHVAPGETFEQRFILTWYFPERSTNDNPGTIDRNMYAKWFDCAADVGDYVVGHYRELYDGTLRWHEKILKSNFPEWLKSKWINNLFPLSTGSVFLGDGRFSTNEAPTSMNGCMGTIDQRAASHSIYTMCFPRLAESELRLFASAQIGENNPERVRNHWNMKKADFSLQLDRKGAIPHDIGRDDFEGGMGQSHHWLTTHWPDLSSVFILQVYAHAAWTGDRDMLREMFPRMIDALAFQKRLDQDNDGIADLWGHGCCTYDSKRFQLHGATPFIATLYLAAIRAVQKTARILGEEPRVSYLDEDFVKAQRTLETDLWNATNGCFDKFRDNNYQVWKGTDREHTQRSTNVMIAQVAGNWFVKMLDLDPILGEDKLRETLRVLYKRNVEPFTWCAANETGDIADVHSWPCYAETYFAANAIYEGMTDEGMVMVERFARAVFEHADIPWDVRLRWKGEGNGEPDWGRWYMTNPSSWFVMLALVGVHYDGLTHTLRVMPGRWSTTPVLKDAPVFLPRFWATLDADTEGWRLSIDKLLGEGGRCEIEHLVVSEGALIELTVDGTPLAWSQSDGEGLKLQIAEPFTLRQGMTIHCRYGNVSKGRELDE